MNALTALFLVACCVSVALDGADAVRQYRSVLPRKPSEQSLSPRRRPESRYVRYMKKLYRMSARHGSAGHLYNTVRLISPRDECVEQNKDTELFTQDLSYNLDQVRSQERLLRSILLYSFEKDQATPVISLCHLAVKQQEPDGRRLCPHSAHHSVNFVVRTDERSRAVWVEVDVTPFLQPLFKSHKKDLHLLMNLTCTSDRVAAGDGPEELALRSPSLLLYLNDTSGAAYQRSPGLFLDAILSQLKMKLQGNANPRVLAKREAALAPPTGQFPGYAFPTDDCELYDFRVSFSQLKLDHWIIAPHKYNPRYCKGVCPRAVGSIYGSPVHTMVQNIIYEKLDSSVPRPSCVPSEYKPLSVLIIESDGSIAYKEYEEMIATKCTCR